VSSPNPIRSVQPLAVLSKAIVKFSTAEGSADTFMSIRARSFRWARVAVPHSPVFLLMTSDHCPCSVSRKWCSCPRHVATADHQVCGGKQMWLPHWRPRATLPRKGPIRQNLAPLRARARVIPVNRFPVGQRATSLCAGLGAKLCPSALSPAPPSDPESDMPLQKQQIVFSFFSPQAVPNIEPDLPAQRNIEFAQLLTDGRQVDSFLPFFFVSNLAPGQKRV